jgi:hypothetical protein
MKTFASLNSETMSSAIELAGSRIVYVAPGISEQVAQSIIRIATTEASSEIKIEIVVDPDPDVLRFGYGHINAIEMLASQGLHLKKASGLRIGLLIVDDQAWVFSPSPLLVEPERDESQPNAISVCLEQADLLLRSVAPQLAEEDTQVSLFQDVLPLYEIGEETLEKRDIEAIRNSLEERPPQKFDLTRIVNVYHGYVQFVHLSLTGCQLSRRTIPLPKTLIAIARNENMQDRLRATFRLVDGKSKAKAKDVERRLIDLRKKYVRSLGERLGSVILRQRKEQFTKEVDDIKDAVQKFSTNVKKQLEDELMNCRKTLVKELAPGVVRNPPPSLLGGITTRKPTKDQAMRYIESELDKVMPEADELIKEMRLDCDFKDVTYEMLTDQEFQEALRDKFPYVEWPKPFEEYAAARVRNGPEK